MSTDYELGSIAKKQDINGRNVQNANEDKKQKMDFIKGNKDTIKKLKNSLASP